MVYAHPPPEENRVLASVGARRMEKIKEKQTSDMWKKPLLEHLACSEVTRTNHLLRSPTPS